MSTLKQYLIEVSKKQIKNMEASLSNDEASTDKELLDYFVKEVGVDEKTAKQYISNRDKYLNEAILQEFKVEEFDEVIKKATKELFKVVEIAGKMATLRPLKKGATMDDEFKIDNKTLKSDYKPT